MRLLFTVSEKGLGFEKKKYLVRIALCIWSKLRVTRGEDPIKKHILLLFLEDSAFHVWVEKRMNEEFIAVL